MEAEVAHEQVGSAEVSAGGKKEVSVFIEVADRAEVEGDFFLAGVGIGALIEEFTAEGEALGDFALQFPSHAPEVFVVWAGI